MLYLPRKIIDFFHCNSETATPHCSSWQFTQIILYPPWYPNRLAATTREELTVLTALISTGIVLLQYAVLHWCWKGYREIIGRIIEIACRAFSKISSSWRLTFSVQSIVIDIKFLNISVLRLIENSLWILSISIGDSMVKPASNFISIPSSIQI